MRSTRLPRLACLLALSLAAFGQSNQATVSGVVSDNQGGLVAGAKINATNAATGIVTSAESNASGFYLIPNLAIGSYTVSFEHDGFRRVERQNITLSTGQTLGLDVSLELGSVNESIKVMAEAPAIDTRTSDFSQLVESKSIQDLPLGNRRTLNVINLTGGAVFVNYANTPGNATPSFSLAGGRSQSQMFWIDGGSGQNMRLGVGQINLDPPVDTVDEIKVLANSYSAEFGGSSGGVIVETTKSGTNSWHGSAYEFLRNDALDAPGFFATVQNGQKVIPKLRYNVFGGTFGGRIRRDKTFFFFAYEGQRLRTGGVDTLTVPTALQRAGNFSQTFTQAGALIPVYDPATTQTVNNVSTRQQFPGNIIPPSRLDPVALKVLNFYPLANRAPDGISGANNFRANYVVGTPADFYMAKIDHNFNANNRVTGRYMWNGGTSSNASVYPDAAADPRAFAENQQQYVFANWTRVITPTTVNDLRFSYIYRKFHNLTGGVGGGYPTKLGLTGVSDNAFPQFSPAGFTAIGSNAQERQQYPIEQQQFVDNFSRVSGRHALKFGFEARRSRNHEFNFPTASGAFTFATTATAMPGVATSGSGLASLLLGFPTGFAANETQELDRSSWYYAAFAQDDWTVNAKLTLNLGVRWEVDSPIVDANNRMNGFDQTQINPVSGTPGVVKFMGLNGFRTKPYQFDGNNFGPRLGFAYKPFVSGRTVVRGGYGIFFSHPFDSGQPNSAALGFSVSAALNTPDNGLTAPFFLRNGVPISGTSPTLNDSFGSVPVGGAANTSVTFYETNRSTGYSHQFNLGVQHQLPAGIVLDVSVIGNLARKQPNANLTYNQISPQVLGPGQSAQRNRPFPQFSDVVVLAPLTGMSNYYAGIIRFQKRYAKGFNLGGSYTYAKFLANYGDPGATLGANGGPYSNFYNRAADYGPEANDVRSRLSFNAVYELPFGPGRKFLSKGIVGRIVGGWSLSNVTTVQSAAPGTAIAQTNTTNAFSAGGLRPNVSENPQLSSDQRSVAQWFNTKVFSQPATYQFGNEGVGILRGARLVNMDFSVLRELRITERVRLQLRGEFFNALNHTNLGLPGLTFGAANFGVISSAGPARQIQVGLRLAF